MRRVLAILGVTSVDHALQLAFMVAMILIAVAIGILPLVDTAGMAPG